MASHSHVLVYHGPLQIATFWEWLAIQPKGLVVSIAMLPGKFQYLTDLDNLLFERMPFMGGSPNTPSIPPYLVGMKIGSDITRYNLPRIFSLAF